MILLIDDDPAIAKAMEIALGIAGYRLETASGPEEAWSQLARRRYAVILLDMNFSVGAADGEEGLALLRRIMTEDPHACVVVITAHSGVRIAVAAIQAGARDFVMKPWRNVELVAKLKSAMLRTTPMTARVTGPERDDPPTVLIGDSKAMNTLRALIGRVGPTAANVLVTGRPGSGRTLVARAILNAAQTPGDDIRRVDLRRDDCLGEVRSASGPIILRHADQLDPVAQEALIDHIPESVRCIGIAATSAPLIPALRRRLATVEIEIPPLAAREDDAVALARHFASVAAERFGRPAMRLTEAAEAAVRSTTWTDEVRGLALAIERAVILADDGLIDAALLPTIPPATPSKPAGEVSFDLIATERATIEAALRAHRHNVTRAASALGLSRGALYRRMERYGL